MCAQLVEVGGRLYFRDLYTRVARMDLTRLELLGPIVAVFPCHDTGESAAASDTLPDGITADGAPVGALVYAVPTESDLVIVDTTPAPLAFRIDGPDRTRFTSEVVEISINSPELIYGDNTSPQRFSTITDPEAIGTLLAEIRTAERIDSSHADNRWDYVIELLRDDGLVTALAFDSHANVINDRAVGTTWANLVNTLTVSS
jgi:hypothetical protein